MKSEILKITSEIEVFASENDLISEERNLLIKAHEAAKNAYAPYSNFKVGAALLLNSGEIITGNNQENAAYPSGLCAERVAIFHASSQYPNANFKSIAITCITSTANSNVPITPCGSCRQAIAEYEFKFKSPIKIIMKGEKGEVYVCKGISELLPLQFNRNSL